ncbi:uncharacterized protein [Clytia hemisphaerica]|uniref:Uncharacterized protein n=1 Tax=Clytia hemisphaerica TaxID=252671 RepID=A0A7M5USW5_9CNID
MPSDKMKYTGMTLLAFAVFVTYVVLASLGVYTGDLHAETEKEMLEKYDLLMFPVYKTQSALAVLTFVADLLWLAYALSCICRHGEGTGIFNWKFFAAYIVNLAFTIGLGFAWWRDQLMAAFIVYIFKIIFLVLTFFFHSYDIAEFIRVVGKKEENKCDVWCHRFIVQNAVLFVLAAATYGFIGAVSIFLHYELGASDFSVSLGMLIFLGIATLVWFAIETFAIRRFTEYTFSAYLVTIFYMSGTVAKVWDQDKTVGGFSVFFLAATCVIFIIRVFILAYRSSKRGSYENITYTVRTETVNA